MNIKMSKVMFAKKIQNKNVAKRLELRAGNPLNQGNGIREVMDFYLVILWYFKKIVSIASRFIIWDSFPFDTIFII